MNIFHFFPLSPVTPPSCFSKAHIYPFFVFPALTLLTLGSMDVVFWDPMAQGCPRSAPSHPCSDSTLGELPLNTNLQIYQIFPFFSAPFAAFPTTCPKIFPGIISRQGNSFVQSGCCTFQLQTAGNFLEFLL